MMKMKISLIILCCTFLSIQVQLNAQERGVFVDQRDGQEYSTVVIGTQIWLGEELNYSTETGSWAPENNPELCKDYGRLYSWEIAKNVCPQGWHLPSDKEWETLEEYLGGSEVAAGKMKETGYVYWDAPNTAATNSSGFGARAAGNRWSYDGEFDPVNEYVIYWSSTLREDENGNLQVITRGLYLDEGVLDRDLEEREMGLSVRCIKD